MVGGYGTGVNLCFFDRCCRKRPLAPDEYQGPCREDAGQAGRGCLPWCWGSSGPGAGLGADCCPVRVAQLMSNNSSGDQNVTTNITTKEGRPVTAEELKHVKECYESLPREKGSRAFTLEEFAAIVQAIATLAEQVGGADRAAVVATALAELQLGR